MLDQEDEGTRIGVWVALGVVFFVLAGVIGGVVIRKTHAKPAGPVVEAMIEGPIAGGLLGKLYFDTGVAVLPADAVMTIDAAIKAMAAAPTRKVVLAGFHDSAGDAVRNAALAKARALATRDALRSAGADPKRVLLRKPESTSGDGSLQEARRVEVRLID